MGEFGVVGKAQGIPDSSGEIEVWLRWCWSSLAARVEGEDNDDAPLASGREEAREGRVLLMVMVDVLADVCLQKVC